MAGAEKIGEAFVELGGKTDPLKKDLDTAKQMTNGAIGEMGQMASRFSLGLGAQLGVPASVGALATQSVKDFANLEDSINDLRVRLVEMGMDAEPAIMMLRHSARQLQEEFRAISLGEIFGAARAFVESGVSLGGFDDKIRAVIGHSGQLNLSFEDTVARMIAIRQEGAAAVRLLKVPIHEGVPAQEQFNATLERGLILFDAEKAKLRSLTGLMGTWKAKAKDAMTMFGAMIGLLTKRGTTKEAAEAINEAAERGARNLTGKTPEQRSRRREMQGVPAARMLTDEELAAPSRPATAAFMGPPAPAPAPSAPAGLTTGSRVEGLLEELVNTVKSAVEQADAIEPFWYRKELESEVRLDVIPVEP